MLTNRQIQTPPTSHNLQPQQTLTAQHHRHHDLPLLPRRPPHPRISTLLRATTSKPTISNTLLRHAKPSATLPRLFSTSLSPRASSIPPSDPPSMTEAESAIADLLSSKLNPIELLVQDVSGGCGSMYAIDITSSAFKGQTILKQQRMVNAALGEVMKGWHGVQIRTKVPPEA